MGLGIIEAAPADLLTGQPFDLAFPGQLRARPAPVDKATDEPVDTARLLTTLEAYEAEGRPSDAEELAGGIGRLLRSTKPEELSLGRRLAWHYRGTNLRFAVSEELLTRFLPKETAPTTQPVSDTILGIPVSGQSLTHNELRARLLRSHGDVVRVLLEARRDYIGVWSEAASALAALEKAVGVPLHKIGQQAGAASRPADTIATAEPGDDS